MRADTNLLIIVNRSQGTVFGICLTGLWAGGVCRWAIPTLPKNSVETLDRSDGNKNLRPVHTLGVGVSGAFMASAVARDYCVAEHFQGATQIPVTVRFSNGSGSAEQRDGWSDVRGMATRFHLDKDAATDLIAMTLPEFFAPTPKEFLEFAVAAKPTQVTRESPWRKILDLLRMTLPVPDPYPGEKISPNAGAIKFANPHDYAQLVVFEAASIGAPVSYARAAYHAVHAFIVKAPDGMRRWVRFIWQPIAGVLTTDPNATPVDDYLKEEMRNRLEAEPVRFSLTMLIGEAGDNFKDSMRLWPPHRVRVMMGTLTLDTFANNQDADCEKLSFNPGLLTDGIKASEDPVLRARQEAYEFSSHRRGGVPRPFSRSSEDGE